METYIGRIAKSCEVEDTEAVESYLDKHPSLYDLVIEARQEITTHFDSGTPVLLDVAVDPRGDRRSRTRPPSSDEASGEPGDGAARGF